ncbi:uncharacterized protein HD556DRAFT_1313596 [Suillus plorans]|uniref:Uncharacterized protein n=1 Tax=Suillus plorans TaxID=116603 RepID=A0A9P7ABV1_9AGAM|nr:uncharacterized protein HD556DRAFT_1313596 [Suillus plorans]KAG1786242.1 hypothetical protein HD556DRAFT_1313596 [Suillus plorans]
MYADWGAPKHPTFQQVKVIQHVMIPLWQNPEGEVDNTTAQLYDLYRRVNQQKGMLVPHWQGQRFDTSILQSYYHLADLGPIGLGVTSLNPSTVDIQLTTFGKSNIICKTYASQVAVNHVLENPDLEDEVAINCQISFTMPYDPDKSSEHSSRGSSRNDGASQILGVRDSPDSERWHFPANGQGAPADSQGNYIYSQACYQSRAKPGLNAQETLDSQRSQSPTHNTREDAEQEHEDFPVNIPRTILKRALSSDSSLGCKSHRLQHEKAQSRRDFARDITNSSQVELPPAKKRRTTDNGDKERLAGLGKEIVMILQEQTALLARVFEAVSQ